MIGVMSRLILNVILQSYDIAGAECKTQCGLIFSTCV